MFHWSFPSHWSVIELGATEVSRALIRSSRAGVLTVAELTVERLAPPVASVVDPFARQAVTLGAVARRAKRWRKPCVVVLPAHLTIIKIIRCPTIVGAEQGKLIRFEAQQALPQALADLEWDHAVLRETDREMDVLLAAWPRSVAEAVSASFRGVGLDVVAVVPSLIARLHAARQVMRTRQSGLLVSLNRDSTDLMVVADDSWALRTVRAASGVAGSAAPNLADAIKDDRVFEERIRLVESEIRRTLLVHRRQSGQAVDLVLLTGDDEEAVRLNERLSQAGDLRVQLVGGQGEQSAGLRSTAIGAVAAVQATRLPSIDLLPAEERRRRAVRRGHRAAMVAVAGLAVATAALGVRYSTLAREAGAEADRLERQVEAATREHGVIDQRRAQLAELHGAYASMRYIDGTRTAWLRFLSDIHARLLPEEAVWIERWQLVSTSAPAMAATPPSFFGQPVPASASAVPAPEVRVKISGVLLDRDHPEARGSASAFAGAKRVLDRISRSPFVRAVASERFDPAQPGLLHFELVVVLAWPLPNDLS